MLNAIVSAPGSALAARIAPRKVQSPGAHPLPSAGDVTVYVLPASARLKAAGFRVAALLEGRRGFARAAWCACRSSSRAGGGGARRLSPEEARIASSGPLPVLMPLITGGVLLSRAYKRSEPVAPGVPFQSSTRVAFGSAAWAMEKSAEGAACVVAEPPCSESAKLTGTPVG